MRPIFRHIILLFILIFLIIAGTADHCTGQTPAETIQFHHLTDKDGLSQRSVVSIIQDFEGYMWFGTLDGLNKYNGHDITIYKFDPDDPKSISYNEISAIIEDHNNSLWIATNGGGLNRYDREKDNFIRYDMSHAYQSGEQQADNSIYSLASDKNGGLWIGTENGLFYMDQLTETFTHYIANRADPESLNNNSINSLFIDQRNNLWVGTYNGLHLFNIENQTFKRFLHDPANPESISDNYIQVIYEDTNGGIWIGTQSGGLNFYDPKKNTFFTYSHDKNNPYSISDNSVESIFKDSEGVFWIGTENGGLNILDRENGRFLHYKNEVDDYSNLNNNAIYVIYESTTQILWVGTYNGGVNIADRKQVMFEHYNHDLFNSSSLSIQSVFSFFEDQAGNFWIGTDGGGLNHFNRNTGQFTSYMHDPNNPDSLPSDVIFDIEQDEDGYLWLATYRGGVSRFDPVNKSFKTFRNIQGDSNSLSNNDVFALHFDNDNPELLWIGTNGGGANVLNIKNGEIIHYLEDEDNPDSLPNNFIREFYEDSQGNFWIGTYGGMFTSYNKSTDTFTSYDLADDLFRNNAIQSIHEDNQKRLWLGTRGGGLKLFNPTTHEVISYTEQDGLPNNIVYGILEDDEGLLWLSTNNGLSKFNPESEEFLNFGIEHGLQSREFNQRAFYKDSSGILYFGGVNGFNRLHLENVFISEYVAPIVFTNFMIFNQPVDLNRENSILKKHISQVESLQLSHRESVFTLEFVTLNFESNKGDEFAYMLEGFDNDWNYVGDKRSATYTNLNHGKYTFRVKAANSHGVWGEEVTMGISITPPFWRTYWFYFLMVLLIGSIVTFGYKRKVRTISEHNKQLEQEVAKQTSEIKSTLEQLKKTQTELVDKAHKAGMADIATGVLHNVGNILNSVNTSTSLIIETISQSKVEGLIQANQILRKNINTIDQFIANNPKGKKLLKYYLKLEEPLKKEHEKILQQSKRLDNKINLINEAISAQQSYAGASMNADQASLIEMIENALALQSGSIERHGLIVEKDLQPVDPIFIQRSKLIHVLVNIFKNAKEAMGDNHPEKKKLITKTWQDEKHVYLSISDKGHGVKKENLNKIFNHGFTTKNTGHGFGLHSCANYMTEMGGKIEVFSEGEGKGATFTLSFPIISTVENDQISEKLKKKKQLIG